MIQKCSINANYSLEPGNAHPHNRGDNQGDNGSFSLQLSLRASQVLQWTLLVALLSLCHLPQDPQLPPTTLLHSRELPAGSVLPTSSPGLN